MVKIYRCLVVVVLCLLASTVVAQVPQWRDLYKVKKKDTLYGIAKKFGLTEDQLRAANPEMKAADYTLKKGDRILIPYPSGEKPVRSMASLAISGWGLPMKVGSRPVAVVSIRHTLPQSGTEPYHVGQTQSGLVAMKGTPRFSRMQASSSF